MQKMLSPHASAIPSICILLPCGVPGSGVGPLERLLGKVRVWLVLAPVKLTSGGGSWLGGS